MRRVISSPGEALPNWHRGIEAAVKDPTTRSIFRVAMYSGMRRGEILTLRWERAGLARGVVPVPHTKTGTPPDRRARRATCRCSPISTPISRARAAGCATSPLLINLRMVGARRVLIQRRPSIPCRSSRRRAPLNMPRTPTSTTRCKPKRLRILSR